MTTRATSARRTATASTSMRPTPVVLHQDLRCWRRGVARDRAAGRAGRGQRAPAPGRLGRKVCHEPEQVPPQAQLRQDPRAGAGQGLATRAARDLRGAAASRQPSPLRFPPAGGRCAQELGGAQRAKLRPPRSSAWRWRSKTTGSITPASRARFPKGFADALAQAEPQRFIATATKRLRTKRIFVDYLRNGRGATAVASYSLRGRPGAPVALPLAWSDLSKLQRVDAFPCAMCRRSCAALAGSVGRHGPHPAKPGAMSGAG